MTKKKVFVSFRYSDGHEKKEELDELFKDSKYVINCSENKDRSDFSEETIKNYLYSKLRGTSLTILLLTERSLEHNRDYSGKVDDWIYDELRYSLEDRENNRSNALIAVYVPNVTDKIFTLNTHKCDECTGYTVKTISRLDNLFRFNMMNVKNEFKHIKCDGIYDSLEDSYCALVSWDDFVKDYQKYIENAISKRERIEQFNIQKRLQ